MIEKRQIWATHFRFVNDLKEGTRLIDALRRLTREILRDAGKRSDSALEELTARLVGKRALRERPWDAYITSFSTEGDQLSQWRGYAAQGRGYSICFARDSLQGLVTRDGQPWTRVTFGPCIYRRHAEREMAKLLLSEFASTTEAFRRAHGTGSGLYFLLEALTVRLRRLLVEYGARLKDPGFAEEQEWRIVVLRPATDQLQDNGAQLLSEEHIGDAAVQPWLNATEFREAGQRVVPYVTLSHTSGGPLPIERIVVGPGGDLGRAKVGLRMFLGKHGLPRDLPIHKSRTPFNVPS